ncbi:hypothetical protein CHS0354_024207 [Potamilus streckersoni]|uniref:Uncharacterized protein n=1 Tax=Potamilus streckersoni TaxID=2493646 RepID=A0AAE0VL35_9BIVA|nr:hypothetical protein CHS0354_024207 [Potamilus streckersoni]
MEVYGKQKSYEALDLMLNKSDALFIPGFRTDFYKSMKSDVIPTEDCKDTVKTEMIHLKSSQEEIDSMEVLLSMYGKHTLTLICSVSCCSMPTN